MFDKCVLSAIELVVTETGELSVDSQTIDPDALIVLLKTTKTAADLDVVKEIVKQFNEGVMALDRMMIERFE